MRELRNEIAQSGSSWLFFFAYKNIDKITALSPGIRKRNLDIVDCRVGSCGCGKNKSSAKNPAVSSLM